MLTLTPLEQSVLDLLLDKPGEPFETLRQHLAHASVVQRQLTGHGFFTDFSVAVDAPVRRDLPNAAFGDVTAQIPGLQHGAGFVVFVRDGVLSMLEGYAYDEEWPENTDEFQLFQHITTNSQCDPT